MLIKLLLEVPMRTVQPIIIVWHVRQLATPGGLPYDWTRHISGGASGVGSLKVF